MRIRKASVAASMFLVILVSSPAVRAEAPPPNPLPAQAQPAFDRGLAAVQQGDWNAAIAGFAEAQKTAQKDPRVLFNLGLAHVKAGHELAGAAWLNAYLAASPAASNANAVRAEIARLDGSVLTRCRKLTAAAISAFLQSPEGEAKKQLDTNLRFGLLQSLTLAGAFSGNLEEAQSAVDGLGPPIDADMKKILESVLWAGSAAYWTARKDAPKTEEALGHVEDMFNGVCALTHDLARQQMRLGDSSGAALTCALAEKLIAMKADPKQRSQDADYVPMCLMSVADACAENGRRDDALRVLADADKFAREHVRSWRDSISKNKKMVAKEKPFYDYHSNDTVELSLRLAAKLSADATLNDLDGSLKRADASNDIATIAKDLTALAETLCESLNNLELLECRQAAGI